MCQVFFIDDEADLRLAIEQTFELADIDAKFFPDAESALIAMQQGEEVGVVVTDICLPGISGMDLLTTLTQRDSSLPVIMITGHGARSITGVEMGLDINTATEKQLEAIPGIGKKGAWNIVSARAKLKRKEERPGIESIFASAKLQLDSTILSVFADE